MYMILDCTLRDGGYINNWRFNNTFLNNFFKIMNRINIDYIEIGFINKKNNYRDKITGNIRSLSNHIINKINAKKEGSVKLAAMADFSNINLELLKKKINVDMIRIAFHKKDLIDSIKLCNKIKKMGYEVCANAMAITNYSNNELKTLFNLINSSNIDYLYIADSYGSLTQKELLSKINLFHKNLKNTKIGLHLHNNMNNAFSNFESISNNNKVNIIDTTLFGMGRGAGNLQTELVFCHLNPNYNIDILIELLTFIQNFIKPFYKKEVNFWGYDIDYLLSGYLKMHPNYIAYMRDHNISMINRFLLIKEIMKISKHNYFEKDIIQNLILQKNDILI